MPSRPNGELHDGVTRAAARPRGVRPVLVALMAALLVLALGWAAVSTLGDDHEARAQSSGSDSGSDSGELAQAAPEDAAEDGSGGGSEPSYEAFGEPRNPFALVVEPAEGDEASTSEDQPQSDATAAQDGDDDNASGATGDDTAGSQDSGSGDNGAARQPFGSTAPGGRNPEAPGQNVVTGPNGERVNCGNPADEFEQLLCEDRRGGFSASDGAGSGGAQGPPGSGGSGRSGAGAPAEQFRNGGGGFVK